MLCEVCGERRAVTKVVIEGVELWVCERCASLGEKVVKKGRAERRKKLREIEEFEVVPDYGARIRRAREKLGLSREELARKLLIKENVLEKLEKQEMLPDLKLAKKLEKALGIKLIGAVQENAISQKDRSKEEALTLGDIVELKVKSS